MSTIPGLAGNTTLGKDAFLNLFVAQLKNQNPLEPMENMEFMSQLTQLTSVEQLTNMSESLAKLGQSSEDQLASVGALGQSLGARFDSMLRMLDVTYANSLIGRSVTFADPAAEAGDASDTPPLITATVDAVQIADGQVWLKAGHYLLSTDAVLKVEQT